MEIIEINGFNNESENNKGSKKRTNKLQNELEGQSSFNVNDLSLIEDDENLEESKVEIIVDKNLHKLIYSTEFSQQIMSDEIGVLSITKNLDTQAMIITFYHHTVNNYGKFPLSSP